jgi:hypothetical protein
LFYRLSRRARSPAKKAAPKARPSLMEDRWQEEAQTSADASFRERDFQSVNTTCVAARCHSFATAQTRLKFFLMQRWRNVHATRKIRISIKRIRRRCRLCSPMDQTYHGGGLSPKRSMAAGGISRIDQTP